MTQRVPTPAVLRGCATLLLARHAESEANAALGSAEGASDSPLSDRGSAQAARLYRSLENVVISGLFSSDTQRCEGTLAPLVASRPSPWERSALLREPANSKRRTEYLEEGERQQLVEQLKRGASMPPPAPVETHAQLVARLRSWISALALREGETVLVVSHFVTLNVLLALLLDRSDPPAGLWADFANASVTRVDVDLARTPLTGTLRFQNWTPFDSDLAQS